MTYNEYRDFLAALSPRQLNWLNGKARWEHMTKWAILNEGWLPPSDDELNEDGSWRGAEG